jgi:hypothetical protein
MKMKRNKSVTCKDQSPRSTVGEVLEICLEQLDEMLAVMIDCVWENIEE